MAPPHKPDCVRRFGGPHQPGCPACDFFIERDTMMDAYSRQTREGHRPGINAEWNGKEWEDSPKTS